MNQITTITRPAPAAEPAPAADGALEAIQHLLDGHDLDRSQSEALFAEIVAGRLSDPLMAATFTALRVKGETAEELIGGAFALRAAARPFPSPDYLFADSCGTGGDCSGSINISTAAGLVAAACGLPIVKHGNRSFTSKCGSADVLEALGCKLDVTPDRSRALLDEIGFCFLLAPQYHPGIAHAGPVRRALKVRTVMNLLGPCLNPARPKGQLLGVADPALLVPIAETLRALGVERALVVHGSGLDEIAPHAETAAVRLAFGLLETLTLKPEDAGIQRQPLAGITGGSPQENAGRLLNLLDGRGGVAEEAAVALNAGGVLFASGKARDFRDGVAQARQAIGSGEAGRLLRRFVEASNG